MVVFEVLFSTKVLTKKSLVFAKADCKLRSFKLNKRAENTLMAITGFNCRLSNTTLNILEAEINVIVMLYCIGKVYSTKEIKI